MGVGFLGGLCDEKSTFSGHIDLVEECVFKFNALWSDSFLSYSPVLVVGLK